MQTLSDKICRIWDDEELQNTNKILVGDVREFIRKLKDRCDNPVGRIIDELAGEALI